MRACSGSLLSGVFEASEFSITLVGVHSLFNETPLESGSHL